MSALGQKRTFAAQKGMSALPPNATFITSAPYYVSSHGASADAIDARFGPQREYVGFTLLARAHAAAG
jgi:hypothetical protein